MTNKHDIIWLDTVESTNEYVKMHIPTLDNLSVVAAAAQTAGKGQGDHKWLSEPGMNLTFSILLKEEQLKSIHPNAQFTISAITATSLVETLAKYGIEAKIKWPNDIYVGDRKICGTLIENSIRSNRFTWSIIGIGLNVNQQFFDPSLPNPTSMIKECPKVLCSDSEPDVEYFSISEILNAFITVFTSNFISYIENGDPKDLRQKYMSSAWHGSDMNLMHLSLSSLQ